MKRLFFILLLLVAGNIYSQTVFNETIGTPGSTTAVATYTGYSNYPALTFSGNADVRTSTPSTGYTGATGSGNVFITSTSGINFEISNINTSSYSTLALTFGHYKTTTASNGSELVIEVSSDGVSYSPLSFTRPTGAGTASWILASPTGTIPSTTNLRIRFRQTSSAGVQFRIDDIKLTGTLVASCTDPGEPTTLSNTLNATPTCSSSAITWNTIAGNGSNHLVLVSTNPISATPADNTAYTTSTVFGTGGSTISGAQVVYNGVGNSVTITNLTEGTTYYYAIYEFNFNTPNCYNYTAANSGAQFTTLTGCGPATPQLLGILANSCDASEGLNEYFVFQNGNTSLPLSSLNVTYPTLGFDYCNSGCGSNTLLNNATAIANLNAASGCTLFTFSDPIPASATVVVFTGNPPTAPPNFNAQCGQLYYTIFCNNTSDVSGRFANSGTGTRTLTVNFGATTDAVTYNLATIPNADGAYAAFDYAGNPTYSILTNCAGPLSVNLIKWQGENSDEGNILSWETNSEINNSYFEVRKSTDGLNFETIDVIPSKQLSSGSSYSTIDRNVTAKINYYQLLSIDNNGKTEASSILSLHNDIPGKFEILNGYLVYSDWSEIKSIAVCDATGKLIFQSSDKTLFQNNRIALNSGLYFIQYTNRIGKTLTQKLFAHGTF